MAHLRRSVTWMKGNNAIGHSDIKTQKRAEKMAAIAVKEFKNKKSVFSKELGVIIPNDLIEEADEAYNEMVAKRAFYEQGKRDGKLWTPEQKLASKQRKAEERKAKRIAAKSA